MTPVQVQTAKKTLYLIVRAANLPTENFPAVISTGNIDNIHRQKLMEILHVLTTATDGRVRSGPGEG